MTINNPQVKRRDLLKAGVAASVAMTVGIPLSEVARAAIQSSEGEIVWTKRRMPLLRYRLRSSGRRQRRTRCRN